MATLIEMAAEIVSSHASTSVMTTDQLLQELQKVHESLKSLEAGSPIATNTSPATGALKLTIKQAFKKDEVVCMVCGKGGMKTLTRHLRTVHDLKPGQYKKQFGISSKQPLTAKSFTEARRNSALERGLGENLAKARATRAANIKAKKTVPFIPVKAKAVMKIKK
jgi:predicted transcriptional regulator